MPRLSLLVTSVCFTASLLGPAPLQGQGGVTALDRFDFTHYYDYEEMTEFLQAVNEAFPDLTLLEPLAESDMGRKVWMLVINNPQTGEARDKPGIFINQIHAGEVIAGHVHSIVVKLGGPTTIRCGVAPVIETFDERVRDEIQITEFIEIHGAEQRA